MFINATASVVQMSLFLDKNSGGKRIVFLLWIQSAYKMRPIFVDETTFLNAIDQISLLSEIPFQNAFSPKLWAAKTQPLLKRKEKKRRRRIFSLLIFIYSHCICLVSRFIIHPHHIIYKCIYCSTTSKSKTPYTQFSGRSEKKKNNNIFNTQYGSCTRYAYNDEYSKLNHFIIATMRT